MLTVTVNRPAVMDGVLHQLGVVIDTTGTYLYIDGALAGSSVNNDWFDAGGATYQTALGNDTQNAIANWWVGTLSNLSQYNGRSLTEHSSPTTTTPASTVSSVRPLVPA